MPCVAGTPGADGGEARQRRAPGSLLIGGLQAPSSLLTGCAGMAQTPLFLLTGRVWRGADFFISALNTKLWILILIITLVYLSTFFIFGGLWWAVYLCAPCFRV